MTELLVPLLLTFISLYALIRKQDVYALLLSGAREGLSTLLSIALEPDCASHRHFHAPQQRLFAWMAQALAPVFRFLGMPPELAPLMLVRPVSGSAALAVGAELMKTYGVDSLIGKTAAVMLGSTETTFLYHQVYFWLRRHPRHAPYGFCRAACRFYGLFHGVPYNEVLFDLNRRFRTVLLEHALL